MATPQQKTEAMPWLGPRKGFSYLPGTYQLVTFAVFSLLLFTLWPGLLDAGRVRSAESVKQALKPKKPTSAAQWTKRLEEHYSFGWLGQDDSSRERKTRLVLTGLQLAAVVIGAAAGRQAKTARRTGGPTLRFGAPDEQAPPKVRARAAVVK